MSAHFLLDTHVLVRCVVNPRRLSRSQIRTLRDAERRQDPLAVSAISLLELAMLERAATRKDAGPGVMETLQTSPLIDVLGLTIPIAKEYAALRARSPILPIG